MIDQWQKGMNVAVGREVYVRWQALKPIASTSVVPADNGFWKRVTTPDPRDAQIAALQKQVAELQQQLKGPPAADTKPQPSPPAPPVVFPPVPASPPSSAPPSPGTSDAYTLSATRSYPAANTYTYEDKALVVRTGVPEFNTGASSYTISKRFFNKPGPEGWLADVYMPNGELIIFDRCVFATSTNGDMAHVTKDTRARFRNCIFLGTGNQAPGVLRARGVFSEESRLIDVQHCYFGNTAGCKLNNWSKNNLTADDTVTWKYNRYDNIMGGTGGAYCQALQLQHVIRPGIDISWNLVVNLPGKSRVEDNFNFGESGGTVDSPLYLRDNCIRGAYPANPTDRGFTGTGFTTDAGGLDVPPSRQPQYIIAERNYVIGCMNACMNIAAGHHIIYRNNICVVAGVLPDGRRLGSVNNAISIFRGQRYSEAQFDYNEITGNTIKVDKANGYGPYSLGSTNPNAPDFRQYGGANSKALVADNQLNTYILNATPADEDAAFAAWLRVLAAQQIQVGIAA
jgi:hypothetical protein